MSSTAQAKNIPAPPPLARDDLSDLQAKLDQEEAIKRALADDKATLEDDIADHQDRLAVQSQKVQKLEKDIWLLSEDVQKNESRKAELSEQLDADRHQIAHFILAMDHIDRVPVMAVLARYGSGLEVAQTSGIMGDLTGQFGVRLKALKNKLETLARLRAQLLADHEKKTRQEKELKTAYAKLEAQLAQKNKLYAKLGRDYKNQDQYVRNLARRADNLQALMKAVENAEAKNKAARKVKASFFAKPRMQASADFSGLPVAGVMRVGYGQKDFLDAKSQGVWIEGPPGGLITAPYGGTVRYAGFFKNYGQLMIIDHGQGYLSLISGFKKMRARVGERVEAGEALGYLGKDKSGTYKDYLVYYELRHSGKAIDPNSSLGL